MNFTTVNEDSLLDEESAGSPSAADPTKASRKTYHTKLAHPGYVVEWCPNCDFPESDGGYCPECGWSAPLYVIKSEVKPKRFK